jgi:hypothetical protein
MDCRCICARTRQTKAQTSLHNDRFGLHLRHGSSPQTTLHSAPGRSMASVTGQSGEDDMVTVVALPPEILQRILGFLQDPDDLASCHMVNTRYVHLHLHILHVLCAHVRLVSCCTHQHVRPGYVSCQATLINDVCDTNVAGSAPQQERSWPVQSRGTEAFSSWRCCISTRCAASAPQCCPSAMSWADTLQRYCVAT